MRAETRLGLSLALGGLVIVLDTTITVVAVPVLVRVFDAPLATMHEPMPRGLACCSTRPSRIRGVSHVRQSSAPLGIGSMPTTGLAHGHPRILAPRRCHRMGSLRQIRRRRTPMPDWPRLEGLCEPRALVAELRRWIHCAL